MDASSSVTELRDAWDQRLVALGDDKKAIESSIYILQDTARRYAERMNALNRIVCLPVEILERVFLARQQDQQASTGPVHHDWCDEAEWVLITHVCRRWRQIAISYPRLWTDVDVHAYGIPFAKEMLTRLGSQSFSLSATAKIHNELLFDLELRRRVPTHLSRLTLNFDDSVTTPGAFLDTLLSHITAQSNPVMTKLTMSSKNPQDMYWSSMEKILPGLTSLHFTFLYPHGATPTSLQQLNEITFNALELTSGEGFRGILELLPALPVLESATFSNCAFSALDAPKVALSSSMKCLQFEANTEWTLQQNRALSRMLTQITGDRTFLMVLATPNSAEEIFEEVEDAVDTGLEIHEVTIEITGWGYLDATIEFEPHITAPESAQPFRLVFRGVATQCWSTFCDSLEDIDMEDANLRLLCDRGTPLMFAHDFNMLYGLSGFGVSNIHLLGKMSAYAAIALFKAMRAPLWEDGPPVAFPILRDICIEYPPPAATVEIPNFILLSVETLESQLDEAALYLLWYARTRRDQDFALLRTVGLPAELLQKHWAIELNDLLERRVISCAEYLSGNGEDEDGDEKETSDRLAVVLYRPVLRALRFWETWILPFVPVITTIGILWTGSRRK